jgi:NAD(P)-dependent dehydrogenase (short-subunit alcohol dehydrogenase family)
LENATNVENTTFFEVDITDPESISSLSIRLQDIPIDLIINNAGIFSRNTINDITKSDLMKIYETNTVGAILVIQSSLENLKLAIKNSGISRIINISSILVSFQPIVISNQFKFREVSNYVKIQIIYHINVQKPLLTW